MEMGRCPGRDRWGLTRRSLEGKSDHENTAFASSIRGATGVSPFRLDPFPGAAYKGIMCRFLAVWGVVAVLPGAQLEAGVLPPGATIGLSGTSFADDNELGGGSRRDALIPFEIRNGSGVVFLSGNLQDSVRESSVTGNLIFNLQVQDLVATVGTAQVVGVSATHYAGVDVTA